MIVRIVEPRDEAAIHEMGRRFHGESRFSDYGWSDAKVNALMERARNPDGNVLFLVAEDGQDGIVGMFVGIISEFFFSDDPIAMELVVYITEEYRDRSRVILDVWLELFTTWAKSHGAVELQMGISAGTEGKGYLNYLKARGLAETGRVLTRRM